MPHATLRCTKNAKEPRKESPWTGCPAARSADRQGAQRWRVRLRGRRGAPTMRVPEGRGPRRCTWIARPHLHGTRRCALAGQRPGQSVNGVHGVEGRVQHPLGCHWTRGGRPATSARANRPGVGVARVSRPENLVGGCLVRVALPHRARGRSAIELTLPTRYYDALHHLCGRALRPGRCLLLCLA